MRESLKNLKKFHLLDEKVEQTVERINQLQARCSSLQKKNKSMKDELNSLQLENSRLVKEIESLKASRDVFLGSSASKEEIRRKLDRVLEKFGELQL